jgi:MFS family permease
MVSGIKVHAPLGSKDEPDDGSVAEETEEKAVGFLRESMEGFAVIGRDRDLLVAAAVATAQTVVAGASLVFGIEIAVQMTTLGPEGIGYLDAALGVGALIGGLVTIARATTGRIATDFMWGCVFWAVPLLLVSIWPAMWPAFLAMFIIGAANPLVDVNLFTMLQRLVDDHVLGRVLGSIEGLQIAGMALGSMLMPLLLLFMDLRAALAVLGIAIAVIVVPAFPRFRRLDAKLREPEGMPRLRSLALFAPLDPKSLERVAQQLKKIEVPAGATVIREGDAGDLFYIVESGALTASFHGEVLSHQGPGDPFGEIALLRDVPRTATVVADEPSVLWTLERDPFLEAVTGNSEVTGQADDLVSRRIPTY